MKKLFILIYILTNTIVFSQNQIDWDGKYQLQQSDFQSKASQIGNTNIYSLNILSGFDFAFSMSNVEFMFTKNFNSKVNNSFKRESSSLVSPDDETALKIIGFANFQFNLSELYARKFRKSLQEGKKTFSNISFFKPIYDDIQKDYSQRITNAIKETDLGKKKDKLKLLQTQVLIEIQELADFCKDCKIVKTKKV